LGGIILIAKGSSEHKSNQITIIDTKEIGFWSAYPDVHHISEFYNNIEEVSIREEARRWVSDVSKKICLHTGKPFYQSLVHKGISAFWFLEVSLHEPAYLSLRRQKAIERSADLHDTRTILDSTKLECNVLPLFEEVNCMQRKPNGDKQIVGREKENRDPVLEETLSTDRAFNNMMILNLKRIIKRYLLYIIQGTIRGQASANIAREKEQIKLYKTKGKADVLVIIEEENLRNYIDIYTNEEYTILPYAEGIVKKLYESLGDKLCVLSKNTLKKKYKDMPFLNSFVPKRIPKAISKNDIIVLEEFYKCIEGLIGKYISLEMLKEIYAIRRAEFDTYCKVLKRFDPKTLFIYNWEGVFRPLIAAAKLQNRSVVGIQQALGPYMHGINHGEIGYWTSENSDKMGFCVPDRYMVWSEMHKNKIVSYGYDPKAVVETGYCRLDRHTRIKTDKQSIRMKILEKLNLDNTKRYLVFTAQHAVLDTCLILKENYIKTFCTLLKLADEFDFNIIVKPWTSDDMDFLRMIAAERPERVFFSPQDVALHNAEILAISDWCIGTFSSIMGEATLLGNACFLLNYPESRYYFETKYMSIYEDLAVFIDSPAEVEEKLRMPLSSEAERMRIVETAEYSLHYVFGKCDGLASDRCSSIVLESLK